MPGANYMGGRRNAAKAKAKDTTGRFEKTFFGQRRLCALSKGLLASKSMQRCNVPLEQRSGLADISLGHARQKIPPSKDVFTSSFIPSPIHISPCTPRSRSRTKRRLEAHSSSSNTSKSAVLDALNISEPMFLRGVLDKILTIPDLAGISRNRTKPSIVRESQALPSNGSCLLQQKKRKRSPSDLYEESEPLTNERPSSSSRYAPPYTYESIQVCTPPQKKYTGSDYEIADKTFKNLLVEDGDIFPYWENTSSYRQDDYSMDIDTDEIHESGFSEVAKDGHRGVQLSPWSPRDYGSSRYSTSLECSSPSYRSCSNINSREIVKESHAGLPTSIVFRGLKDGLARRSMVTATYPVEEPTVYGTLFKQADPWDAIGQILGLSNTKPSKGLEAIDEFSEINDGEAQPGPCSAVIETEEREEGLTNIGSDEIPQVQSPSLIERRSIGLEINRVSYRWDSLEDCDGQEVPGDALSQSSQLCYLQKDVELQGKAKGFEDDLNGLSGDVEDKRLFSLKPSPQDMLEALKSPDRIRTRVVECDYSERSSVEEAIYWSGESKPIIDIPELQELDGLFIGPSLFDGLDEED